MPATNFRKGEGRKMDSSIKIRLWPLKIIPHTPPPTAPHHHHQPPLSLPPSTMIPRKEFQAKNQFTFYNPIHRVSSDQNSLDGVEYGTWAERIKGGYGYFGRSDDHKFGAWKRRTPLNHYANRDGEDAFRWPAKEDGSDSDVASPPLWKEPGSPMSRSGGASPIHVHHHNHRSNDKDWIIYPTPRAQAIAGYRQEMLDMVRDMPETAYELSLRDIVESPRIAKPVPETLVEGTELSKDKTDKEKDQKKKKNKVKKGGKRMSRSESMDTGGFLLKMFLPSSLLGRKKSFGSSGTCAKVSPKPMLAEGEKGGLDKSTDRDWWKKKASGEEGGSSSSSSSSSSSGKSWKLSACYSFFRKRKNKAREN